ncbi:MAG: hypothetical protein DRN42_04850 [Thermoplasmata archaeon]|nr:MAG: hypothetical protein DRN42_04850 [Thermoplasmata archaeon]
MSYDEIKEFRGRKYSGMRIGAVHRWSYPDGRWWERKITPNRWEFTFTSTKERLRHAPEGSGAKPGTEYHWLIIADQRVRKLDEDRYSTVMFGRKFKVGHKRPTWRGFSYIYPEQPSYKELVISYLREVIEELEGMNEEEIAEYIGRFQPTLPTEMRAPPPLKLLKRESCISP